MIHIDIKADSRNETENIDNSLGRDRAAVLFLFAFGFRIIYVIQSADNPLFGVPIVDAHVYAEWAGRMAQGVWLWDYLENYLPIYPAFLALQQIVFGSGPLVTKIIQSLMGSLSAVMLAQVAARTWNRNIGLITGYLIATNWMLVVFEAEKYAESFSIFFQSLTLWLLILFTHRLRGIIAAGFAFALSAGVRANLFLVLPFISGWLLWRNWPQRASAINKAVLFCLGTVLIIGPIVLRNYQLTGAPLLRALSTWNLYTGVSPEFEGLHPPTGILYDKYMNMPLEAGLRTEVEVERFWTNKALEVARQEPLKILTNFLRRLVVSINAREWSQEFDVYTYRGYSGFLSLPWTGFWLIGPFGLLGFCFLRRITKNQWLVIGYTVVGFLSIIPFKGSDRYRLPTVVLLTIFAAVAIWYLYLFIQNAEKRKLYKSLAVLGAFCMLCWPDWQNLAERKTARHNFYIGLHNESIGKLDEAVAQYEISMKKFPWDPDSPYRIGRILRSQGQPGRGLVYLKEALRREPHFPEAMNEIARIYLAADLIEDADLKARDSLKLNPIEKDTLLLMADIRQHQGNIEKEIEYLNRAALEARDSESAIILADRLVEMGNYEYAVGLYDRVMHSRKTNRYLRVQAAMLAGILATRHLKNTEMAQGYWLAVYRKFRDFKFFALQADYMLGVLDENTFRKHMQFSNQWQTAAAYMIGLKNWSNGDLPKAEKEFQRCLDDLSDPEAKPETIPQKWAWEDLRRIRSGAPPASIN
jgi:tetratricopeptide (TPR) repeat protein